MIALPHTTLSDSHLSCAYSQKLRRFVPMMQKQGCEVALYGPDLLAEDCRPDEHIIVASESERRSWGFHRFTTTDATLSWDPALPYWRETNARAAAALATRSEPTDILCLTTSAQWPIAAAHPQLTVAEWTVGYEGIHQRERWFCAFESSAWRHHVYGLLGWRIGRAFDTVIPNFFDPCDFHLSARKGDHLLFLGRVIERKGPHVAAALARRADRKLIIAGPGGLDARPGSVTVADTGLRVQGDLEYVGEVGRADRARLLAEAAALIVPTLYLEPFGGVAVEAMLSGTPVVASDWGAFTETVTPDVGARFSTLAQAEAALEHALTLDPAEIRHAAIERYSVDVIGARYADWFRQLDTLWRDGWYAPRR